MVSRRNTLLLCVSSMALISGSAFGQTVGPSSKLAVGAGAASSVAEIVVTAQKREQSINSVGMSIQAATGETLTKLGVTDAAQLTKIIPGFHYTTTYYGTPVFTLRGVGFNDTTLAASPTVSVSLDEVPLPFSITTSGAALDVSRVEVLKGPQGTLFGENATGGAINYIANKPTDTLKAGFDASYGRFNTADISAFVSGPLTDTLDYRIAVRTLQSGPWQKNYTRPASIGSSDFLDGRISLLWKPTSHFKALFTVNAWQDKGESQMPQLFGFSTLNPVNGVDPRILASPLAPHNDQAANWSACVNRSAFDEPFNTAFNPAQPANFANLPSTATNCVGFHKKNDFYSGSLRLDVDLVGDVTLTSLTAYEHFDRYQPLDSDGVAYQDFELIPRGRLNTVYQEVRVSGQFRGKGSWIVGGNYENDTTFDGYLDSVGGSSATPLLGFIRFDSTDTVASQTSKTYAAFGNIEYPILNNLTLQGGVRYTQADKTFYACSNDSGDGQWAFASQVIQNFLESVYNPSNGIQGQGKNVGPGGCATTGPGPTFNPGNYTAQLNENNVSWRVGANWKVYPDALLYVNLSQGYKAGSAPNNPSSSYSQLVPVHQEGLLAYEGGFKASLLDRTLQLNGAVFYYDYKDKQILGALSDPIFGPLPALVNIPRSHVVGFELSGAWEPVRGLTLTPSMSYAQSRIGGCSGSGPGCVGGSFLGFDSFGNYSKLTGEPFPNAPVWSADVDGEYDWKAAEFVSAFVGLNVNYEGYTRGSVYDAAPNSHPSNILELPAHTLVDLRAGVERGPWRFQLWGRNIFNTYYLVNSLHVNDVLTRYTGRPATYGATFTYRFN